MSRRGGVSSGKPAIEWAGVILTNNDGEVLLNLRGPDKMIAPGSWDLIGGTMECGEEPDVCVVREVMEETGERLSEPQWFRDYDVPLGDNRLGRLHVFGALLGKPASELQVGEGIEHRFFSPEALETLHLADGIQSVLRDYISSGRYQVGGAHSSR